MNVVFEGRQYSRLDVSRPENADSGELTGIELNYQQQFTFLPGLLRGLGVSANATFVDSKAKVFGRTDELPFFSQSDRLANASVFYELAGFGARLAVTHRSPALVAVVSPGFDVYATTRTQVDLKVSYAIDPGFSISADILNINNASAGLYSGQKDKIYARNGTARPPRSGSAPSSRSRFPPVVGNDRGRDASRRRLARLGCGVSWRPGPGSPGSAGSRFPARARRPR